VASGLRRFLTPTPKHRIGINCQLRSVPQIQAVKEVGDRDFNWRASRFCKNILVQRGTGAQEHRSTGAQEHRRIGAAHPITPAPLLPSFWDTFAQLGCSQGERGRDCPLSACIGVYKADLVSDVASNRMARVAFHAPRTRMTVQLQLRAISSGILPFITC
jgi:hypothetical protein